jgi:hypothetical protein
MPGAVYIPQPDEISTTTIWEFSEVPCEGKSFLRGLPGVYLYEEISNQDFIRFHSFKHESTKDDPGDVACSGLEKTSLKENLTQYTGNGSSFGYHPSCYYDSTRPPGSLTKIGHGVDEITIGLGTLKAERVDTFQEYHFYKLIDHPQGEITTSEWYACGLGLIRSFTSHKGKYQERDFNREYSLELISYTPFSTNESQVRYILADIELSNTTKYYREYVTYEEAAEALRRWEAGVRVMNSEEFERKLVNESW